MSKGRSPQRQKQDAQRRQPYTAKQRAAYEPCDCDTTTRGVSMGIILAMADKQADLKLSGGYNTRKSNICGKCYTAKSVNGTCNCM
jgi:hypothetical protein